MNLEFSKFLIGSLGLILLTIVSLIFIWYEKDVTALGYFAIAFAFLASSSRNIKDITDLKKLAEF